MTPEIDLFTQYGWVVLLLYILIREGLPIIAKALPMVSKERMLKIEQAKFDKEKADERERLRHEKRDLREERMAGAMEGIAKVMAVQDERLSGAEAGISNIEKSMTIAITALAIILDRLGERLPKVEDSHKARKDTDIAKPGLG